MHKVSIASPLSETTKHSYVLKGFAKFYICIAIAAIVLLTKVAYAGSYAVSYSGGTIVKTVDGQVTNSNLSTFSDAANQVGYNTNPTPSINFGVKSSPTRAYSSSLVISGTIHATFTWQTSTNEPPPTSAVIKQDSTASWTGTVPPGGATVSGAADDGLQDTEVANGTHGGLSSGKHYKIKNNPSYSFTEDITINISVNGTGALPFGSGTGSAAFSYFATATPVVVNLTNTTPDSNGVANMLIGQGTTATVSAGNYSVTGHTWTINGDIFNGFVVNRDSAGNVLSGGVVAFPPGFTAQSSPHWFWQKDATNIVSCNVVIWSGSQIVGTADAQKTVIVQAPIADVAYDVGTVKILFDSYNNVYRFGLWDEPHVSPDGYYMKGMAITPSLFVTSNVTGSVGFVQVVTRGDNNIWQDNQGYLYQLYEAGLTHLDAPTSVDWLYFIQGTSPDGTWNADGNYSTQVDSPHFNLNALPSVVSATQEFDADDWLIYNPPGSDTTWVPLYKFGWSFSGTASGPVSPPLGNYTGSWTVSGSKGYKSKQWLPDPPSWDLVKMQIATGYHQISP